MCHDDCNAGSVMDIANPAMGNVAGERNGHMHCFAGVALDRRRSDGLMHLSSFTAAQRNGHMHVSELTAWP